MATISGTIPRPVHFAGPTVDVLFETAAAAHGPALAGILLTGAGSDGSLGLKCFQEGGGITIVQDPRNAECDAMSRGALREVTPDYLISLAELPPPR